MPPSIETLEERLGYRFKQRELLAEALTHSSLPHDQDPTLLHNERLEFLGDAVLALYVSEALFRRWPAYREGLLTRLRSQIVNSGNLSAAARRLGLGDHLRLGRQELSSGGRAKRSLLADALEAVLAAIYLDGGPAAAAAAVERLLLSPEALEAALARTASANAKSALQELLQSYQAGLPEYRTVAESGPPHERVYRVEVRVGGYIATGEGQTKRDAEQQAARQALDSHRLWLPRVTAASSAASDGAIRSEEI